LLLTPFSSPACTSMFPCSHANNIPAHLPVPHSAGTCAAAAALPLSASTPAGCNAHISKQHHSIKSGGGVSSATLTRQDSIIESMHSPQHVAHVEHLAEDSTSIHNTLLHELHSNMTTWY
jgi:hypothetical protein